MLMMILKPRSKFNSSFLVFQIRFLIYTLCEATDIPCYFPDGTQAVDDIPCNPLQNPFFCCGRDWECLSNGLCHWGRPYSDASHRGYARGSCTDSKWQSDDCPRFCLNGTCYDIMSITMVEVLTRLDVVSGGLLLTQCVENENTFCCNGDCNCSIGLRTISFQPGFTINNHPYSSSQSVEETLTSSSTMTISTTMSEPVSISSSSDPVTSQSMQNSSIEPTTKFTMSGTSILNTSSTSLSRSSISTKSGYSHTASESSTTLSPTAVPASSNHSSENFKSSPSENVKIGVGIGIPIGLLLISAIVFFSIWRERRLKGHMRELRSRWIPASYFTNEAKDDGSSSQTARNLQSQDHALDMSNSPRWHVIQEDLRGESTPQEMHVSAAERQQWI